MIALVPPPKTKKSRYTPPKGKALAPSSPKWFTWITIFLLVIGVFTIVLNYLGFLPGTTEGPNSTNFGAGIALTFMGFLLLTRLR